MPLRNRKKKSEILCSQTNGQSRLSQQMPSLALQFASQCVHMLKQPTVRLIFFALEFDRFLTTKSSINHYQLEENLTACILQFAPSIHHFSPVYFLVCKLKLTSSKK